MPIVIADAHPVHPSELSGPVQVSGPAAWPPTVRTRSWYITREGKPSLPGVTKAE
jgi:hypothetical protein